jgi:predicted secreted protein
MSARARRVAVLAHCHLNVNTKVIGLADYASARHDLVSALASDEIGIVQLPCPEATFLGMKRWGMTREQYDTSAYRRHCAEILKPVIDTLVVLADDGCRITAVYGIEGSPSCGVARTCAGYAGGEIEELAATGSLPAAHDLKAPGVFMELFMRALASHGLHPEFIGIDERRASAANGS